MIENRYMLAIGHDGSILIMNPPSYQFPLTREHALNLAAWIVALSDPSGEEFQRVLGAVKNT